MNRIRFVALLAASLSLACSSDEKAASHGKPDASHPGDASTGSPHHDASTSGDAQHKDVTAPVVLTSVIEVKDGKVQGDVDRGTRRFRGIPYAKPPVGDLRWKPPAPAAAWTAVLQALDFKSECAQPGWIQGPESDEEDCLYLNVWTPDPVGNSPLPVMVWLPGGGNQNGGASDNSPLTQGKLIYDGRNLSANGKVIVVTINYRLGVFGFFSHPGLAAEGSVSGNQGLSDQQAALKWVRDNIEAFGGDPKNVTLFGESAGSQDTCLQVVSPGANGLFHRAMSESGGCTTFRKTKAAAEQQVAAFSDAVGCSGVHDELACLRGKTVKELLVAAPVDGVPDGGLPGGSQFSGGTARWDFNPVVDGTVIPDQPRTLAEAGTFAKVPYVLGSNFEEGKLFMLGAKPVTSAAEYTAALGRLFGASATEVEAVYKPGDFPSPQDALVRVWGDFRLGCTTDDSARRFAAHGAKVFAYHFSRPIPGLEGLAATHGTEMPYVFGTLAKPPTSDAAIADDTALSEAMEGYWTRFARAGDPNGGGAPAWPTFDDTSDKSMGFDVPSSVLTGFRRKECNFWRTIYDAAFP
jgi:para-nitrobenzyl esterase